MWTKGLDPRRIAKICRVPYRKVYDHIRTRVNHNPTLFGQRLMLHDHPQMPRWGLKNRKPTWQERVDELAAFRRVHGRFPRGYVEDESKPYSFLQHQRNGYRANKLPASRESYLNAHVPGWLTPRKQDRENSLWKQRAVEFELFLRSHGRYPRYKTAADAAERTLSVWLKRQRHCLRNGNLKENRTEWLNERFPGWDVIGE